MSDAVIGFIDHMRNVGCGPSSEVTINPDDRWHRYRIDGDKPKVQNGSYKLKIEPDGFAVGVCRSFREAVNHGWHSKSTRKATADERAEWKRRAQDAAAAAAAEDARIASEAADRARAYWSRATVDDAPYLTRKRMTAAALGVRVMRGAVVVPMWCGPKMVGLQFIGADGGKRFLTGTAKQGAYHVIKGRDDVVVVGEGLATCGAIHDALGCMTVVAFDAGNLRAVVLAVRAAKPNARIVIAADGDQWTIPAHKRPDDWDDPAGDDPRWVQWRRDGLTVNTGRDKALDAAMAIGGAVVVHPPIPDDDAAKRTDFWDVWNSDGPDAIRSAFDMAMNPPAMPEPDYDDRDYTPHYEPDALIDNGAENPLLRMVRPLGRSGKTFYFFPRVAGQIMDFTGPALANVQNLVTMAPMSVWQSHFGGSEVPEKKMASMAANALIEECNRIGIYNPDSERGVGVWIDSTGPVFNAGDALYHAGGKCSPADYQSEAVYVMGARVGGMGRDQLGNADGGELLSICLGLTWKNSAFGYILAGWMVAAIVGGALRWRPHIVLTGENGSGKTWVLENIVKPTLGGLYLERDGGTTEAKIRQDLGGNARPVIMDEAESETQKDRNNMESVLTLARKASTGAAVGNAYGLYYIRSCFMFSAINPRIVQGADLDRNTIIQLVKDRRRDAPDRFKAIAARVLKLTGGDFAERLLARCFHNLPVLLRNIEVFSDVIAAQNASKRFGDQFGTLIACAFSLTSTREVTREFAAEWCGKHDWKWAVEDNEQSGPERLVEYILSARVRYDQHGIMRESLVATLVDRARHGDAGDSEQALQALGQHAIRVQDNRLLIGSPCQQMKDMLKDTPWGGNYRRTLGEVHGAEMIDKVTFAPMLRVRAVSIPLDAITDPAPPPVEIDLPFGGW